MAKKIRMGPSAPPLHEQLEVEKSVVREEQSILDIVTKANQAGSPGKLARGLHSKILKMLEEKGLIKLKS